MKESPIIFSGPMVRAIIEGRKTATRRPIKPQPAEVIPQSGAVLRLCATGYEDGHGCCIPARGFYRKGDLLWVKETWSPCSCGRCGGYLYREKGESPASGDKWRSPILMPRAASRITLEVMRDSWPQRVRDLSIADIQAEGFFASMMQDPTDMADELRDKFCDLWESLYAQKPEYQWTQNPWVWVHEFRRVTP